MVPDSKHFYNEMYKVPQVCTSQRSYADNTVTFLKFSDVLLQTLDLWGIEKTTVNLQKLGRAMKDTYGIDVMPNTMVSKIASAADRIVVLDRIHWSGDVGLVRNCSPSAILYITAPPKIRF